MLDVENRVRSLIALPPIPEAFIGDAVAAWSEPVNIDSYLPGPPDIYPAFLDSRVYQGSSGRVYPLPFHERIAQQPVAHEWQAVHLENEWVRIMILPELGGRIHVAYDKVAEYDIFYRNNVIKPALVGLAGPWISGGVEFNWPQHHRPATFLPTDVSIEHEADGSITVWSSDHDPFARMKGMHGIRLRPDSSLIEARVRLFNRSEVTQSFLWWANVAAAVNDDYQSFFPTDVDLVADHARRAVTTFPHAGRYYGVDYPNRATAEHPEGDRLDWYRNIPVPTSYMVLSTDDEFFGGYDHGREAGFVHWARSDIAPGKKQWTWGNDEFGWAWDRNLTDADGPYVELMAGVFTDNQPDFAWLAPGETKTFSQYWYPIQKLGPVHQATRLAAASLTPGRLGVAVTSSVPAARILLQDARGTTILDETRAIAPGVPVILGHSATDTAGLRLTVTDGDRELVSIVPRTSSPNERTAATEPPAPDQVVSVEELVFIGHYLDQYRHATRSPEPYWLAALHRDRGNARASIALGARRYLAAQYEEAADYFRAAIARETAWVPTPANGEAHYRLALTLVRLGRDGDARSAFGRAAWDSRWRVAATWALARLHARSHEWELALEHLAGVAAIDPQHLQAADLRVRVLRELGRDDEAQALLEVTLALDPLDQWALDLAGRALTTDAPTLLDIALEYAGAGFPHDALRLLDAADAAHPLRAIGQVEVAPLVAYHRTAILSALGKIDEARAAAADASAHTTNSLPSRLEDIAAIQASLELTGPDALALALLGHWYYDRGRRIEAIDSWGASLVSGPDPQTRAIVERNLGVASFNVLRDPATARAHYLAAIEAAPDDARLWFEYDQLLSRSGESSSMRFARLDARRDLVAERDDLTVGFAGLLVHEGRASEALDLLKSRDFQPWEGGEGQVIAAWDRASLSLAGSALARGDAGEAVALLEAALRLPRSLGEARHPLANIALLDLALGDAYAAAGRQDEALARWTRAAEADGDFTGMQTRAYSAQTYYSILALGRLGRSERAQALTRSLAEYADALEAEPASIDYFATSLPTMLLFNDDPQNQRDREVSDLRDKLRRLHVSARRDSTAPYADETGWQ